MEDERKRYRLFGWDYERVCPLDAAHVAWYRGFADATGGPVLELACGSGRLACALAVAGAEVVALDLTEEMLALCRRRAGDLRADVRRRLEFVRADMRDFDLGRRFALAIVADNSFRELNTTDDQLACLRCAGRHLVPGGTLLVTIRRFDPSRYPGGVARWGWSNPLTNPDTGETITRRIEVRIEDAGTMMRGNMVYKVTSPHGSERIETCPFTGPVQHPEDYEALFRQAGLVPTRYVGYQEKPDDGRDPILCYVCRREDRNAGLP